MSADEFLSQHDSRSMDELLSSLGIAIMPPQGRLVPWGGRKTIGVIRVVGRSIRVVPRCGVSYAEYRKLRKAAVRVWLTGTIGPHWIYDSSAGWVSQVCVRHDRHGSSAASARAIARSLSIGAPISNSSSRSIG